MTGPHPMRRASAAPLGSLAARRVSIHHSTRHEPLEGEIDGVASRPGERGGEEYEAELLEQDGDHADEEEAEDKGEEEEEKEEEEGHRSDSEESDGWITGHAARSRCDRITTSQEERDEVLIKRATRYLVKGKASEWRIVRFKYYARTGDVAPVPELKKRLRHLYDIFLADQSPANAALSSTLWFRLDTFHRRWQEVEDEVLLEVVVGTRLCLSNQWDAVADAFNAQMGAPAEDKQGKDLRARVKRLQRAFLDPESDRRIHLSPYLRSLLEQYDLMKPRPVRVNGMNVRERREPSRNPEVGTLQLEEDTRMVRAFLDGAFWIRQSTGKINELHQVVATSRGSEWTSQDVQDQIDWLLKVYGDWSHRDNRAVNGSKPLRKMLRDLNECVSRIRPYLAILNREHQQPERRTSLDVILMENVRKLEPFREATEREEYEAWVVIAEQLNSRLQAKVLFTGASCSTRFYLLCDVLLERVDSPIVEFTEGQRDTLAGLIVRIPPEHTWPRRPIAEDLPKTRMSGSDASSSRINSEAERVLIAYGPKMLRILSAPLFESIEARKPSKPTLREMRVWARIRVDVNGRVGREAISCNFRCQQLAVALVRRYKTQFPDAYAAFSSELKALLGDGPSQAQPNGRDGHEATPSGTASATSAVLEDRQEGNTPLEVVTRAPQAQPRHTVVAQIQSEQQQSAAALILQCEQRMKQYIDEKLRGMVSEDLLKQYVDARILGTNAKITGLVGTIEHVREDIQAELASVENKLQRSDAARRQLEERVNQRFTAAANVFGNVGGETQTNAATRGTTSLPRLPPIADWHHDQTPDVAPPRIAKKARIL